MVVAVEQGLLSGGKNTCSRFAVYFNYYESGHRQRAFLSPKKTYF